MPLNPAKPAIGRILIQTHFSNGNAVFPRGDSSSSTDANPVVLKNLTVDVIR